MRALVSAVAAGVVVAMSMAGRAPSATAAQAGSRNAIAGTVVDESGAPVAGVLVTLVQRESSHGRARFHPADVRLRELTDARGVYRIENAPLGEYFVVAIPQNPPTVDGRVNRVGYAITYHPSARGAADARPVMVNVREAQIADIRLTRATLAVVAGSVIASDGQPTHGGILAITHGDNLFGLDSKGVRIRPDGTFLLGGLSPGTYILQFREGQWPPPPGATPLVSGARVTVAARDIAGLRVVPIHMVHATGRIIVDPAARAALQPASIHVGATPVSFDGNPGPQRPGIVKDDLTFEFSTWPGTAYVRVMLDGFEWRVRAIRYKGAEVTDTGIDFQEAQEVSGIEIDLVRGGGGLESSVSRTGYPSRSTRAGSILDARRAGR